MKFLLFCMTRLTIIIETRRKCSECAHHACIDASVEASFCNGHGKNFVFLQKQKKSSPRSAILTQHLPQSIVNAPALRDTSGKLVRCTVLMFAFTTLCRPSGRFQLFFFWIAQVDNKQLFAEKRVVVFGVVGAFTGTCSNAHMPSFMKHSNDLKARGGVNDIVCITVNDPVSAALRFCVLLILTVFAYDACSLLLKLGKSNSRWKVAVLRCSSIRTRRSRER